MSVDLEILEILINCQFPPCSYRSFAGQTRACLRRLSIDDLENRVRNSLPPCSARTSLVSEFMSLMYRREGGGIVVKQEVKLEAADSSTADSPPPFSSGARDGARNNGDSPEEGNNPVQQGPEEVGAVNRCQDQEDDSDSDVVMVEEVIKSYVAVIGVVDAEEKAKSRVVEEVVIQDEEQLLAQPKSPPIASSSSGASTVLIPRGGKNVSFSIPQKSGAGRKRKAAPIRSDVVPSAANKGKIAKKSIWKLGRPAAKGEWSREEFAEVTKPPHSLAVEELSIISNCNYDIPSSPPPLGVHLPNLKILKLRHRIKDEFDCFRFDINYYTQLCLILAGAPALARIEICYEDEIALKSILHALGSMEEPLKLLSLFIRHQDEEDLVALVTSDLIELTRINAPNLQELHLAFCIWADGDGKEAKNAVENILTTFPNLVKLKITGCFTTAPNTTVPKIVLNFPRMKKLETLDLGASCKYSSILETVEERPKKKKRKKLVSNLDPGVEREKPNSGNEPTLPPDDDAIDDAHGEYFAIGINFQGLMPSLKNITLGVLYEFQTLFFTELPALKVFRVASGWAQTYPAYFPARKIKKDEEEGEGNPVISQVEQLQFPDSFQDAHMISRILPHFPNLTHVFINLPTVKFLRSFARTMQLHGPPSFKHLMLKTQFEFASSLESCVLDKIVRPSYWEREQLRILKAYDHWEDYVKENQIELPEEEEVDEDVEKFCGLRFLFKKLKTLKIRHIPRTLRLPKGTRHWIDHPVPEYTDTLIGFKEYPFTRVVNAQCPDNLKKILYDIDTSRVANEFNVKPYYESGRVRLEPTDCKVKSEVKPEKDKEPPTPSASVISC